MSRTTTTGTLEPADPTVTAPQPPARSALALRRWFLILSPLLAGLLAVLGSAMDPAAGITGPEMWQLYADNPDPLQWKSFGLHWSYTFWMLPALAVLLYVRGRGAWLANLSGLAGLVGMSTMPGLLIVDFYDSAIGQVAGVETSEAVMQTMSGMWGVTAIMQPATIAFIVALPLTAAALWRARVVRWWAFVAVLLSFAAITYSNFLWWGAALTTVLLGVFSFALWRGLRDE